MSAGKKKKSKSAVALNYVQDRDAAPKVTAKGEGLVAERIIALAKENDIPIKEDPDLVQVLSQVDLNREIPPTVYHVVAELLAFVYKLNHKYQNQP
ncbi:MAG: flagellar biosynthesis protein FlhB [Nitrospinaceae bacterium]|nr:flagellar biosynthesis protein FlhB [Nitrospinaceae bacterium]NIR57582.1 flagellar biosynthesis protein FlhB [Nitrospinaceae bacterium]NIS88052.1 flagellar biosynthesis protein FlhB [Nitrospinaceae bacterium]NIT84916.1 flagellar biosynthesis protein FlhB [Nitrospinaceae bacterium]NIU47092.1 flagellar biosynthesis protein FlhB [Nitrospinaceae bacterium]